VTAQVRETISVDGEQRSLCALPLALLFRSWRPEPRFMAESSANWRGYRGSWEIVGTNLSEVFENEDPAPFLEHVNGILVPAASASAARKARFARRTRCSHRSFRRRWCRASWCSAASGSGSGIPASAGTLDPTLSRRILFWRSGRSAEIDGKNVSQHLTESRTGRINDVRNRMAASKINLQ
jgi:hypothetical protein